MMSEVQRFYSEISGRECVYSKDFDAAQSELAALREELDLVNLSFESNFDAAQIARAERDLIQQRLADAERRNSELVELLQEARIYPLEHACATVHWPAQELVERIDAALQPTESGASE